MKRLLFLAAFLFVGTGATSADYVLLKINLNQLNFLPNAQMANLGGAGAAGQVGGAGGGVVGPGPSGPFGGKGGPGGMPLPGGAGGGIPPGGQAGAMGAKGGNPNPGLPTATPGTPVNLFPNDPNARWITALVEVNNVGIPQMAAPYGAIITCDTHYGKNTWVPYSTFFPMLGTVSPGGLNPFRVLADSFSVEFATKFNKVKKDKNIDTMLHLARWTLSRGNLKKFHDVMDEATKLDEKNATVKRYQSVKKALEAPFKNQDPVQRDLIDELTRTGYKERLSKKGHYGVYAPNFDDPSVEAGIKRRLNLLEDTLETFYFWFAMQKDLSKQPALPKYRLLGIVTGSNEDFISRHAQWGSQPRVADGFTPLRENVIVMSAKVRVNDPNFAELNSLISSKLAEANNKLQQMGFKMPITRENLLSGEINMIKESGRIGIFVSAAQTAVLLAKSLEDHAERHTVTNEGTRQLLIASGMLPRNVQVPDWIVEGLAAFFENPAGGAYPTIGERSCVHLISFKQHRTFNKEFANPADVLQSVISDTYFQKARQLNKDLQDSRDEKDRRRLKESWEIARCTSWAFIYYLSQKGKLDQIANYGKELDKLPRDMDLSSAVLQGCFAKAFDMADPNNPQRILHSSLQYRAQNWLEFMDVTNLDNGNLQAFLEKERAKDPSSLPNIPVAVGPNPNPNPAGPNGVPPGWVEFTSNAGGYRAVFPEQPKESVEQVGPDLKAAMATVTLIDKGRTYIVAYTDLPVAVDPDLALDGGVNGIGKLAKVTASSKITLGNHPGREAQLEKPSGEKMKSAAVLGGKSSLPDSCLLGPQGWQRPR